MYLCAPKGKTKIGQIEFLTGEKQDGEGLQAPHQPLRGPPRPAPAPARGQVSLGQILANSVKLKADRGEGEAFEYEYDPLLGQLQQMEAERDAEYNFNPGVLN